MIDTLASMILKQEHILIGGTTGSGKTTLVQSIISAICTSSSEDKKFAIIDLKKVSLREWSSVPHCIAYADEMADAVSLIRKFENTMVKRLDAMLQKGDNVKEYWGKDLYLIIDEAAFLMMNNKECIAPLTNIGVLGRAAKIHLIYCTQIPNRKTIPAEIQATCPCTIALRCAKPIESRQLIGSKDCCTLPKVGEGYLVCPEYLMIPKRVVVHKADEDFLAKQIEYLKTA